MGVVMPLMLAVLLVMNIFTLVKVNDVQSFVNKEYGEWNKDFFPAAEAATELSLARRLALYPNHFWVLMDGKQLVGFVNGKSESYPVVFTIL